MVLREIGMPMFRYSFSSRYCGIELEHFVVIRCAMKLGAYRVFSPTRSGAGAVTM
jgi:hypothetical protein